MRGSWLQFRLRFNARWLHEEALDVSSIEAGMVRKTSTSCKRTRELGEAPAIAQIASVAVSMAL